MFFIFILMKTRKAIQDIPPYVPGVLKEGAIKMASNENPLGPSPKAVEKIKEMLGKIHIYPDIHATRLREKLSQKTGLSPDQLVIGNGSDDIMVLAAAAYLEQGDEVLTYRETFSVYSFAGKIFGGQMRYMPLSDGKPDLAKMAAMVNAKTKIVFLCNPNNPTGAYFSQDELDSFLKNISREVLVVIDEAYGDYATASDFPKSFSLLDSYPNILVLRTFSKICGLAGLRVGYGAASEKIIVDLNKVRQPFNANLLAQAAAMAALDDDEFIDRSKKLNEEGKAFLYREFKRLGLRYYETQANFIFVHLGMDAQKAFEKIMALGVTIRPLKSFGYDKAIRVTVGTMEQNKKFIECLENIF